MRSFASIALFVLLGLASAVTIGFGRDLPFAKMGYDEEQEGLSERIIIKFSHVVAENTPKGLAVDRFSKLVKEKTKGRVEVQVFPNGILYSDNTELDALMQGEVQMIAPAYSKLSNQIPPWLAMDLPYAFRDEADVQRAVNGEIGRMLFQTLEPFNIKGMAFWSNGFKQFTSNQLIHMPEDLQGQRFRIMPSKVLRAQFQALGAETEDAPFTDVYGKLADGAVDGQENTISNIYTKRLFQVQKYMTISNHGYLGYAVIMNRSFWEKLPPDIQADIEEAMQESTTYINELAVSMNERQLQQMKKESTMEIHELTPQEQDVWRQAMQPVYTKFAPSIGKPLMDQIKKLHQQR
jgi:tripartite ATP-independent transporter DctP family solute receptor